MLSEVGFTKGVHHIDGFLFLFIICRLQTLQTAFKHKAAIKSGSPHKKGNKFMETLISLAFVSGIAVTIVKILGFLFDSTYSSDTTVGREEHRSIFDTDEFTSSSSMFDDSSTNTPSFDDDDPSRGLWDPSSIYYDVMHSDDHSISGSIFDDSWSSSSSISSFDD